MRRLRLATTAAINGMGPTAINRSDRDPVASLNQSQASLQGTQPMTARIGPAVGWAGEVWELDAEETGQLWMGVRENLTMKIYFKNMEI